MHVACRDNLQAAKSPSREYHALEDVKNSSSGNLLHPQGEDIQENEIYQSFTTYGMTDCIELCGSFQSDDLRDGIDEGEELGHHNYVEMLSLLLTTGTDRLTLEMYDVV